MRLETWDLVVARLGRGAGTTSVLLFTTTDRLEEDLSVFLLFAGFFVPQGPPPGQILWSMERLAGVVRALDAWLSFLLLYIIHIDPDGGGGMIIYRYPFCVRLNVHILHLRTILFGPLGFHLCCRCSSNKSKYWNSLIPRWSLYDESGGLTRHQSRSTKTITCSVYTYEDQHNLANLPLYNEDRWNTVRTNIHTKLSVPLRKEKSLEGEYLGDNYLDVAYAARVISS